MGEVKPKAGSFTAALPVTVGDVDHPRALRENIGDGEYDGQPFGVTMTVAGGVIFVERDGRPFLAVRLTELVQAVLDAERMTVKEG